MKNEERSMKNFLTPFIAIDYFRTDNLQQSVPPALSRKNRSHCNIPSFPYRMGYKNLCPVEDEHHLGSFKCAASHVVLKFALIPPL